jgi:hypothetical protein
MPAKQPLKIELPVQGWKQFLTSRKEMLDDFDSARQKAKSQEVETHHGRAAEALFRDWLAGFLPKRYGVTSGYVVSQGLKSKEKTPHFDVIIYDQLEAPVLWIEGTADQSAQGRSLAIPAEYVQAVIEVKSRFTAATVGQALEHLSDLSPLASGFDNPDERYKLYLPATFCCGLVFFELAQSDISSEAALNKVVSGIALRGFFGGVILRAEGHANPLTGRITLLRSETPMQSTIGRGKKSLLNAPWTESIRIADNVYLNAMLMWGEPFFSQFAFDLLALLRGTYKPGFLSSFHGMGTSAWEQRDDLRTQDPDAASAKPDASPGR